MEQIGLIKTYNPVVVNTHAICAARGGPEIWMSVNDVLPHSWSAFNCATITSNRA